MTPWPLIAAGVVYLVARLFYAAGEPLVAWFVVGYGAALILRAVLA